MSQIRCDRIAFDEFGSQRRERRFMQPVSDADREEEMDETALEALRLAAAVAACGGRGKALVNDPDAGDDRVLAWIVTDAGPWHRRSWLSLG